MAVDQRLRTFDDLEIVQIAKNNGTAFLDAVAIAWQARKVALLGDNAQIGIDPVAQENPPSGGGWWEGTFLQDRSDNIAQISSTSGTTSAPKAIAISRRAISDTVDRLVDHMEIDSTIREYIGVPVTFSFGLGRARAVAASGGLAYLPESGFRPDEIARMLHEGEINALSAVPTMLRTILAHPEILGQAGRKLRWLEIGSQFMSADEKNRVRELFPEAVILQHYGLTEASRSTFLRIDGASAAELASVGRPVGDGEIRVVSDGRIEVRGSHVASGIVQNGKITSLTDQEGWLSTNDLGEIRDGWLNFIGRSDDVANVGGVKVSAEQFERHVANELGTDSIGVCVVDDELRGEKLALAVPIGTRDSFADTIYLVAADYGLRPADLMIEEIGELPRTATGKLQRNVLSDWFEAAHGGGHANASSPSEVPLFHSQREEQIAAIWAAALGASNVRRDDSFYDLGGDSLSAVSVLLRVEQAGLPNDVMQRMFAGQTVAQIAAALDGEVSEIANSIRSVRADALNAVRGLLALLIVVSHWGPFFIDRMGAAGDALWSVLGPFLRIGTPGFAMIYGVGLGLLWFGQLDRDHKRMRRRIRNNTALLVSGVLLIAGIQAWNMLVTETPFGPDWPEQLFYEVLLFYALMVPTSLFWLRRLASARDRIFASLLLAFGAYAVHAICLVIYPVNTFTGWASLAWHMVAAPYAYPRLLGGVALGLAAAFWLLREDDPNALICDTAKWGLALAGLGFLLVTFLPGGWTQNAGHLAAVPAFAGAVFLLFSGSAKLALPTRKPLIMRLAIVSGVLAFPIFVGHSLVIPAYNLLEAYGLRQVVSLILPTTLFVGAMSWFGWRIYRMMFNAAGVP